MNPILRYNLPGPVALVAARKHYGDRCAMLAEGVRQREVDGGAEPSTYIEEGLWVQHL